jgi:hypothetical protein
VYKIFKETAAFILDIKTIAAFFMMVLMLMIISPLLAKQLGLWAPYSGV